MLRKLLGTLGPGKILVISTGLTILASASMYAIIGAVTGHIAIVGIVSATVIPAVVAPPSLYLLLKLLSRLDLAERTLAEVNSELELRVEQRTAELVKTNEDLQIEIAERRRAEERITASLHEKEILLREIHHRVKNNLQVISSLLSLQAGHVGAPQVRTLLQDSQNRIRSMVLVHEKLYQSENLAQVDFAEYVRGLAVSLLGSCGADARGIALKVEADDVFLGIDEAVPCGLILNELVSNALKHAFPDGRRGEIWIGLSENGARQVTLTVGDDGVGLPRGLDFRATESLGLQLVTTLMGQLGGEISLAGGRGTEFKITVDPRSAGL